MGPPLRSPARPILALLVGSLTAIPAAAGPAARNAILVSIDSLRADHLELYGYPRATLPALSALVERRGGIVYEHATAVSPSCHPSHAALLTGRYPQEIGVPLCGEDLLARHDDFSDPDELAALESLQESLRAEPPPLRQKRLSAVMNWLSLPPDEATLATRLSAAGFRTGGAVSIWTIQGRFGYARGFDTYSDEMPDYYGPRRLSWLLRDTVRSQRRRAGAATADTALAFLREVPRGERFFLFVHFADTHVPYTATGSATWGPDSSDRERVEAEWSSRYGPDGWERARRAMQTRDGLLLDRYDDAIRSVDDQLARLFAELERRGELDDTAIVVTSDHGDSFGQHAFLSTTQRDRLFFEHSVYVWQETQHVPLLVIPAGPARPGGARRVGADASQVDVAPTLLAALDVAVVEGPIHGRDLAAPETDSRPSYFLTFGRGRPGPLRQIRLDFPKFIGLRRGDVKFFVDRERFRDAGKGRCFLFDLASDPDEQRDLCADQSVRAARLRAELVEWYERTTAARGRDASPPQLGGAAGNGATAAPAPGSARLAPR